MFDFHVHTSYSGDCNFEMESYIIPAIEKGLRGICFTDHIDIDFPGTTIFEIDYDAYFNEIKRLKDKYSSKLEILTGIEFGMQPHILDKETEFFSLKNFDYVLGSIHASNKKDLYGGAFMLDKTVREAITGYFLDMIDCAKNFKNYNNLGHIDAIARYVEKGSYTAAPYMDYIEELLRVLIHNGKGIELNTSGKRYGLPEFHPEPSILKLYNRLGGEIVTLGSDSHSPNTLGYGFEEASYTLQQCGFKYYTIYRGGKPEFIKL